MDRPVTPLAPTAAELGSDLRGVLALLRRCRFSAVQLAVSGPSGIRPRSLTASARRDLAITLRRLELRCAGLDLWIPPVHFSEASRVDRAVAAVCDACDLGSELGAGALCIELDLEAAPPAAETLEALVQASHRSGVRLAVCSLPGTDLPGGAVRCVDPPRWLAGGHDPAVAVADPSAVPRLSDLVGGVRAAPCAGGRLDATAYRIACEVAAPSRPVVADLRGLSDPAAALQAMELVWKRGR